MKIHELIKYLVNNFQPNDVVAYDIWSVEDVRSDYAGGSNLTQEEAEDVLQRIDDRKDATIGITWDTVSTTVAEVISER